MKYEIASHQIDINKYEGETKNNLPHGKGVYLYEIKSESTIQY